MFNSARLIGPSAAGFLVSALGEGNCFLLNGISYLAVIAALYVIKLRPLPALSECLIFGLGLASLSLVKVIWLFLPLLVLIGFGMMLLMASSNTILQTISDDDKRGRVMSFYTISLMGMHPLGSL